MNEQALIRALSSMNVWWEGLPVPSSIKKAETKRKIFYDISKSCLDDNKITCITGPRQVGKTTIIGQLVDYQLKEKKVDPKRIIYAVVDSDLLKLNADNVLLDTLKVYFDYVLGESPQGLKSKVYIYLDEVQSLDGWAKLLKSYEIYPNIKFIISGSSQSKLHNDSSESLVGRINFRLALPFKFTEFVEFNYGLQMPKGLAFSTEDLREGLKSSIGAKDPSHLYRAINKVQVKISSELPNVRKLLSSYLIKGGYPGALEYGDNYAKALERIRTDLELTVYKDIHKLFNTRNSSDLMTMLVLLASSCGQKINYSSLSDSIGIDRRVVMDYLYYTSMLFLTSESKVYRNSKYKQAEKNNKAYLIDLGHRNALLGKMDESVLTDSNVGFLYQCVVYNHACRLRYHLSKFTEHEIYYWEDGKHEVDVIVDLPIMTMPIEVKSNSGEKAIGAMKKFMEDSTKAKWGIIVTLDELKIEGNILFMPLWAFLLMC